LLPHLVMPLSLQNILWGTGSGNEWETMQLTSNWPGTISSVTAAPPSMCLLSNTTTLLPALAKYAACNSYEGDEFGHWLWMALPNCIIELTETNPLCPPPTTIASKVRPCKVDFNLPGILSILCPRLHVFGAQSRTQIVHGSWVVWERDYYFPSVRNRGWQRETRFTSPSQLTSDICMRPEETWKRCGEQTSLICSTLLSPELAAILLRNTSDSNMDRGIHLL